MICSMHSLSVYAVKAVTFASIMHTSNEVAFEERGGIDALVVALQSDNMGPPPKYHPSILILFF